jgi:hypothetical protein
VDGWFLVHHKLGPDHSNSDQHPRTWHVERTVRTAVVETRHTYCRTRSRMRTRSHSRRKRPWCGRTVPTATDDASSRDGSA